MLRLVQIPSISIFLNVNVDTQARACDHAYGVGIAEFVRDSTKASLQRVLRTKNMESGVLMKILIVKRISSLKGNL